MDKRKLPFLMTGAGKPRIELYPHHHLSQIDPRDAKALHLQEGFNALQTLRPDQVLLHLAPLVDIRLVEGPMEVLHGASVGEDGFHSLVTEREKEVGLVVSTDGRTYVRLHKNRGADSFEPTPINIAPAQSAPQHTGAAISVSTLSNQGEIKLRLNPLADFRIISGIEGLMAMELLLGDRESQSSVCLRTAEAMRLLVSFDDRRYFELEKLAGSDTFHMKQVLTPASMRASAEEQQMGVYTVYVPSKEVVELHVAPLASLQPGNVAFPHDAQIGQRHGYAVFPLPIKDGEGIGAVFSPDHDHHFYVQKNDGARIIQVKTWVPPRD